MAYVDNATFTEADVTPVLFDTGLKVLAGIGTLATVIGIVIAVNLLRGKKWNGR